MSEKKYMYIYNFKSRTSVKKSTSHVEPNNNYQYVLLIPKWWSVVSYQVVPNRNNFPRYLVYLFFKIYFKRNKR